MASEPDADSLMRADLSAMQARHPSLSRARCIGMLEASYIARRVALNALFNAEFATEAPSALEEVCDALRIHDH